MSHRPRSLFAARCPAHITIKLIAGLPSLRREEPQRVLLAAFRAAAGRFGMYVIHFSVQSNHIHLVVEADDRAAITRGMKGLQVRFARNLNKLWTRRGPVFADRYHDHVLRTPREVRNAIAYVLHNSRKHGLVFRDCPDPFSSGRWFPDWEDHVDPTASGERGNVRPISPPRTWLARVGWRRHGRIAPHPMRA